MPSRTGVKWTCSVEPGTAFCFKRIAGTKNPWMTSSERNCRSTSRLTGSTSSLAMMSSLPWASAGIEADGIAEGCVDELRAAFAVCGIDTGIVKVPLELLCDDFDMQRGGRRAFKTFACPEMFRHDGHDDVEGHEQGERKKLSTPGGGCGGLCAADGRRARRAGCWRAESTAP